nr:hypothetical protein [Angustibacter aerolatus]
MPRRLVVGQVLDVPVELGVVHALTRGGEQAGRGRGRRRSC